MSKKRALEVEVICLSDSDTDEHAASTPPRSPTSPHPAAPDQQPCAKRPRLTRNANNSNHAGTKQATASTSMGPGKDVQGRAAARSQSQKQQHSSGSGQDQRKEKPGGDQAPPAASSLPAAKKASGSSGTSKVLMDWLTQGPSQPASNLVSQPPAAASRDNSWIAKRSSCNPTSTTTAAARSQPAGTAVAGLVAVAARAGQVGSSADAAEAVTATWVDKHKPKSGEELSVHKKKVAEVRGWLESQLPTNRKTTRSPRLLIVAGPSGCGKSTTVEVLAGELGYQLLEWSPSTHTTWSEAKYQGPSGWQDGQLSSAYVSKLEEFSQFLSRAKFTPLMLRPATGPGAASGGAAGHQSGGHSEETNGAGGSQPQEGSQGQGARTAGGFKLIVIDDLPHVHDATKRQELGALLSDLCLTSPWPVVLVASHSAGQGLGEGGHRGTLDPDTGLHKDIQSALNSAGAGMILFNRITDASVSKVLLAVSKAESKVLSKPAADMLAAAAGGDIRHALQSLQLMFAAAHEDPGVRGKRGVGKSAKKAASKARSASATAPRQLLPHEASRLVPLRRDTGLELFHALGKILYNKRDGPVREDDGGDGDTEETSAAVTVPDPIEESEAAQGTVGGFGSVLQRQLPSFKYTEQLLEPSQRRPPMRYDPEDIVVRAALEPLPLVSFLAANYLKFMGEGELEDCAKAAEYLSDAAYLSCYRSVTGGGYQGYWGEEDTTANDLTAAVACSVATRGLLYCNQRPAPPRFTAMRGSGQSQLEAAMRSNQAALGHMAQQLAASHSHVTSGGSGTALAAQLLPSIRLLAGHSNYQWLQSVMPTTWSHFSGDQVVLRAAHVPPPQPAVAAWGPQVAGTQGWAMQRQVGLTQGSRQVDERGVQGVDEDPIEDSDDE